MLLAVLARHCDVPTAATDVYASAVGGVRIAEPGLDLALSLAIASSIVDRPLPPDLAVFGEVGLGGEVRQVAQPDRRFSEAHRLGFTRVIAPLRSPEPFDSIEVIRVSGVSEALKAAGLL
jgi:DNA repair protein RadA/Sms